MGKKSAAVRFEKAVPKIHVLRDKMVAKKIEMLDLPDDVEASRRKWVDDAYSAGDELGLTYGEVTREILWGPFPKKWSDV